ncbi:MAG: hypothetical protein QOD42_2242 [Sphingomonadales bacterium]|jgi:hypothetical protein|nr:hypothetical protein [Sphingomonadales bacterium]
MRAFLIAAPFALAAAMPATAQPAPPINRQQALDLSPAEIADIVFRQLGARMTEMERPTFSGLVGPGPLGSLRFATAPRLASNFGLCVATIVAIGFEPLGGAAGGQQSRPVRASSIDVATVYKVVDEVDPGVERAEADNARLEQSCGRAGRVLPTESGDLGQHRFFHFSGASHPWMALRALRRAIRGASGGTYRNIACDPEELVQPLRECRDPAGALSRLDLADLLELEISPTGAGQDRYRIEATFLISAEGNSQFQWVVVLDAGIRVANDARTMDIDLGRALVSRAEMAFD